MVSPVSLAIQSLTQPTQQKPLEIPKTAPSAFDVRLEKQMGVAQQIVNSIEQGGLRIDKLLNTAMTKNMTNSELLVMQAGMYKYSQELDLTTKVIDKAVNGLRDLLKTQV
jgi:flagellar hook-basal body complex protein FliE